MLETILFLSCGVLFGLLLKSHSLHGKVLQYSKELIEEAKRRQRLYEEVDRVSQQLRLDYYEVLRQLKEYDPQLYVRLLPRLKNKLPADVIARGEEICLTRTGEA